MLVYFSRLLFRMTVNISDLCRFSPERLSKLAQIERQHFWFAGRRELVDHLLEKHLSGSSQRILDLGCGTGSTLERLLGQGHCAVGLDMRPEGLEAMRRATPRARLIQSDVVRLPLVPDSLDAVLLLDVLEHLDDVAALAGVLGVLKPGSKIFITVPAMPWLWSYRDEAAGHLRRYTRERLTDLLTAAGLRVVEMRYYQFLLFPLVALTRTVGRRGPKARDFEELNVPVLNSLLTWVNKLEVRLGNHIHWPFGSSLVAVCQKDM